MGVLFRLLRASLAATAIFTNVLPSDYASAAALRAGQADPDFGDSENGLLILNHGDGSFSPSIAAAGIDGEIIVTGSGSVQHFQLLTIDPSDSNNGGADIASYKVPPGFTAGAFDDIEILPDGSTLAAGYIIKDEQGQIGITCKITPLMDLDPNFSESSAMPGCALVSTMRSIYSIATTSTGEYLLSGYSDTDAQQINLAMVHLGRTGEIDETFANGAGIASAPNLISPSIAKWSVVSANGSITTLAVGGFDLESIILTRHTADGMPDESFSDDGAMTVAQHATPVGMAVHTDGAIILAVIPESDNVRALTLMKFKSDGEPALEFQGLDAPPGRSQIAICQADCVATPSHSGYSNDVFLTRDNHVVIGGFTYYPESTAGRPVAVRADAKTGLPDFSFGDQDGESPPGVGRGIALGAASPEQVRHFSVQHGDRLMVFEQRSQQKIAVWGFLGDRILEDSFE